MHSNYEVTKYKNMYGRSKKWKELEEFVKECRKEGVASSFKLLTTSSEIIIIANNKPRNFHKTKRLRTVFNI